MISPPSHWPSSAWCPLLRLQNFKLVNQNMWSKKHHGRSKFRILTLTIVQAVPATRGRPVVDDPRFFFLAPSSALRSSLCSHHHHGTKRRREEAQFCVGALPHRMWAGPCARAWDTGVSLICFCFCICICICRCRWWPTASMECLERSDTLWLKYFVRSKHGLDGLCQLDQDHHERGEGRRMFS